MRMFRSALVVACAQLLLPLTWAELRIPEVLSSHAVLQRDRPVHVWGWSSPSATVTVRLHGQTTEATADKLGRWSVYLLPEKAGGPYELDIEGDGSSVRITDVLMGDVWLASGQSNMEMPLAGFGGDTVVKNADKEISSAANPNIRLLLLEHKSSDVPINDVTHRWTECTPETAKNFSAVAYFFGRELAQREQVPIGLIDATWGGTPADSWVSLETLGSDPRLLPAFASRAAFADSQSDMERLIAAEKAEDEAAKLAGRSLPKHPWHPFETSWLPSGLYDGMIAPLTSVQLKGFLWYQGETNSSFDRAPHYHELLSSLIADWRMHFAQGELPFLFVQISSFFSPGEDWGRVRDEQRRTLDVANTAMAVTLDVGKADNVHPPDKQTVAARLALAARNRVYGERVGFEGPTFQQATTEKVASVRVWFEHADGLALRGSSDSLFELAGADRHFHPAHPKVEGSTVVVVSEEVPVPRYIRYGWSSVVLGGLYNSDQLPASTFASDIR